MATQIKLRRDTAANWTLNGSVVLAAGEPGFETNTGKLKIGNGNDDWSTLSYVSGGGGDRLVNGVNEVVLGASGGLEFPNSGGGPTTEIYTPSDGSQYIFESYYAGGRGSGTYLQLDADSGIVSIRPQSGANTPQWTFDATGALNYPNVALQRDTGTVSCPGNASTVVYTVSGQYQHAIRLFIQVEGSVPGQPYDTQACEMIIAKSFRANALAASVYGVVHTSVAPLATFTANWNALTNRVEVLCATTAIAVNVRIFATEITTSD